MADHTPGPCGCHIDGWTIYDPIRYCPTHAAAPDLLAALEDHHDHDDAWCFACHRALHECSAVAAIAKAKETE